MANKKANPTPEEDDCHTLVTFCLTETNERIVRKFQAFVIDQEKRPNFGKPKAINRIIKEWAEDRSLTLEVKKK